MYRYVCMDGWMEKGKKGKERHTLTAVFASTLYCSKTRARSSSLGILKRVMRSMGAIFFNVLLLLVCGRHGVCWDGRTVEEGEIADDIRNK